MSQFSAARVNSTNISVSNMVTGDAGIGFPVFTTATRPSGMTAGDAGCCIYDSTLEQLVVWNGSAWVPVGRALDVLPTWDDSTRPTTGLVDGRIGFNTDGNVIEIYWDPGEPGDNEEEVEAGWITPFGAGEGGKLFDFTSYTFKSIVSRGDYEGPTESQIQNAYSGEPWNDGTYMKQGSARGYQQWTVPEDGNYEMELGGARGGRDLGGGQYDFWGAKIKGTFALTKETELELVVGVGGNQYYSPHRNEAGGGGGSFVKNKTSNQLLIAAGGGGGSMGGSYGWGCGRPTGHSYGRSGEYGGRLSCYCQPSQPSPGNGGSRCGPHVGGAGGGYNTNGQDGSGHCGGVQGGRSWNNGMIGGRGDHCYTGSGQGNRGGFGGGGGGNLTSPGAAGGWTGGCTGGSWSSYGHCGGGGGSYNTGTNKQDTQGGNTGQDGGQYTGNGYIKITKV